MLCIYAHFTSTVYSTVACADSTVLRAYHPVEHVLLQFTYSHHRSCIRQEDIGVFTVHPCHTLTTPAQFDRRIKHFFWKTDACKDGLQADLGPGRHHYCCDTNSQAG